MHHMSDAYKGHAVHGSSVASFGLPFPVLPFIADYYKQSDMHYCSHICVYCTASS